MPNSLPKIEFSNDAFNGKTKTAGDDQYLVERKPIKQKGLYDGAFVKFKDKTKEQYGILSSLKNNGQLDWVDFTNPRGDKTAYSDLAIKFDGSFKLVEPKLIGLKATCRSNAEDEIDGIFTEDEDKNLCFVSNSKNDLLDDFPLGDYKYSCILLTPEERREMNTKALGRVRSAIAFIRSKNFDYKFTIIRGEK